MERTKLGYGVHVADAVQHALKTADKDCRISDGSVSFFTIKALERFTDALVLVGFVMTPGDVVVRRVKSGHPRRPEAKSWFAFVVPTDEDVNVHIPVHDTESV